MLTPATRQLSRQGNPLRKDAVNAINTRTLRLSRPSQLLVRSGQDGAQSTAEQATPAAAPPSSNGPLLTLGAVATAVALFAATRMGGEAPTLATLEKLSTPLEVALANEKPTVIEFYANWCEVCRELVEDEYKIEQQFKDKVNFVMLNIENSKWAPEVAEFRVRGIPHFVFVTKDNEAIAAAVGRLPQEVLQGNVEALAQGKPLPFTGVRGEASSMAAPSGAAAPRMAGPRDHA